MQTLRLPVFVVVTIGSCLTGFAVAQVRTSPSSSVINLGELRADPNPEISPVKLRAIRALSQSEVLERVRRVVPQATVTSLSGQKWRITPGNLSNGPIAVNIVNISRIQSDGGNSFLLVEPGATFSVYFSGLKSGGKYLVTLSANASNLEIETYAPNKMTTSIKPNGESILLVFQVPTTSQTPQIHIRPKGIMEFTSLELTQIN